MDRTSLSAAVATKLPESIREMSLYKLGPGADLRPLLALERLRLGCASKPVLLPTRLRFLTLGAGAKMEASSLPRGLLRLDFMPQSLPAEHLELLPPALTALRLPLRMRGPLRVGVLPLGLTRLEMGESWNEPISPGLLPSGLRVLALGAEFSSPVAPGELPDALRVLRFGTRFCHPLPAGALPPRLEVLHFGDSFNESLPLGVLPATLRELVFGVSFNHPLLAGTLPSGLRRLKMGSNFASAVEDLPAELEELHLGEGFAQGLPPLPASLRLLVASKACEERNGGFRRAQGSSRLRIKLLPEYSGVPAPPPPYARRGQCAIM